MISSSGVSAKLGHGTIETARRYVKVVGEPLALMTDALNEPIFVRIDRDDRKSASTRLRSVPPKPVGRNHGRCPRVYPRRCRPCSAERRFSIFSVLSKTSNTKRS